MSLDSNDDDNVKKNITNEDSDDVDDTLEDCSLNPDTRCGLGCVNLPILQRFANQNTFIIIYGLVGCVTSMIYAYYNGTITTLEKRFHLTSRSIGIPQIGNDFTQMATSLLFIHYISKKHRPHWMAFGIWTICLFCLLATTPHWLYGAGENALKLTTEFGGVTDEKSMKILNFAEDSKNLCNLNSTNDPCKNKIHKEKEGHPIFILFMAQVICGFGYAIFYTLGYAYMDDNVEKSKTASLYSFSLFLNMLGPSFGYTIASFCLRQYIAPTLTPSINDEDPRWIGAWWMGWLIFGCILFVSAFFLSMFPKELPAYFKRKQQHHERLRKESLLRKLDKNVRLSIAEKRDSVAGGESSLNELLQTLKRILGNKIFVCNNLASIFYNFGYMPYWIFTPKYLEVVFRQSTAESNVYIGTVALAFTAVGVLGSGAIISRFKPSARILAGWNAIVSVFIVAGFFTYSFIGCPENENSLFSVQPKNPGERLSLGCLDACHCEFVPYAPVCGENNLTYISACHAGCKELRLTKDGDELFDNCECVRPARDGPLISVRSGEHDQFENSFSGGNAKPGACKAHCFKNFLVFLFIMCSLEFLGASTSAAYFLIQMRSVAVKDKTVSLAFSTVMVALLSSVPSPLFYGWLIDRMCLVWGKTCAEKSNCWLYDSKRLRLTINFTASIFLVIGAAFDCANYYFVKDLDLYNDDDDDDDDDGECDEAERKSLSNMELDKLNN